MDELRITGGDSAIPDDTVPLAEFAFYRMTRKTHELVTHARCVLPLTSAAARFAAAYLKVNAPGTYNFRGAVRAWEGWIECWYDPFYDSVECGGENCTRYAQAVSPRGGATLSINSTFHCGNGCTIYGTTGYSCPEGGSVGTGGTSGGTEGGGGGGATESTLYGGCGEVTGGGLPVTSKGRATRTLALDEGTEGPCTALPDLVLVSKSALVGCPAAASFYAISTVGEGSIFWDLTRVSPIFTLQSASVAVYEGKRWTATGPKIVRGTIVCGAGTGAFVAY